MQRKLLSENESENAFFAILQDPVKKHSSPVVVAQPRPREDAPRPREAAARLREAAAAVSETYRPTEPRQRRPCFAYGRNECEFPIGLKQWRSGN